MYEKELAIMDYRGKSSERNETSTSSSKKPTRGFDLFRRNAKQDEVRKSLLKHVAIHDVQTDEIREHVPDRREISNTTVEQKQKENSNNGYRKTHKKTLFKAFFTSIFELAKSDQVKKKSPEQIARLQEKAAKQIQVNQEKAAKQIQVDQNVNLRRENKNRALEQKNKETEKGTRHRIKPALKRILTTTACSTGTGAAIGTALLPGIGTGVVGAIGMAEGVSVSVGAEIVREVKRRGKKRDYRKL